MTRITATLTRGRDVATVTNRPGGWVVVGEPYLFPDYAAARAHLLDQGFIVRPYLAPVAPVSRRAAVRRWWLGRGRRRQARAAYRAGVEGMLLHAAAWRLQCDAELAADRAARPAELRLVSGGR
jgi:hypothetical protein